MADIAAIAAEGPIDRERLARISQRLQRLTGLQALFPVSEFPPPAPGSGKTSCRYLLYQDPRTGVTLYLNTIVAGKTTKPHNHGTWAVIVAIEGEELNRIYRRTDDGSDPGHAVLELEREYTVKPGAPIEFMPDDIHSIHVDQGPAVRHLHLYGQPLESLTGRLGFDLETGEVANYNKNYMRPTVGSDLG
ncbi:cysteine dioxygenase family protein [Pigmentiphaga soli]